VENDQEYIQQHPQLHLFMNQSWDTTLYTNTFEGVSVSELVYTLFFHKND